MRMLIITIFLATTAFSFFLKYLTYSRRNAALPGNVRDVYDDEMYRKNQAYKMETLKSSIARGLIGMSVTLAFLGFNFHHRLYAFISAYTTNVYLTSIFILLVPIVIVFVIHRLISIYDTFVTEACYGFNKSTASTFIIDFVKMMLVQLVLMSGLLALFLFLLDRLGDLVFLVFFFVIAAVQTFMNFIAPLIMRLILKFTPLEEGELKVKIEALCKKTGYKSKGIYVVDASKRTTKMNAEISGFGKTRTIMLYDTLLKKLSHDEIVSILAHEIGHAKKHHIMKGSMSWSMGWAIMVAAAYFIVTMPEVSMAFGFASVNVAFAIYVLFIMLEPVNLVLSVPEMALSRKHEYEADAFGVEQCGKEAVISGLKKLHRESFDNLTPHPFVVMMQYSHPTLSQRMTAMEKT